MAVTRERRREFLGRIWIFDGLQPGELDQLAELTVTRKLNRGEILFTKGSEGDQLFGVMSGRLRISTAGPDGKEIVFAFLEPGEVFGEIALLDSHPRSATVAGLEASELLTLHRRDFLPFLDAHPKVAVRLASILAGRVRRLSEQMEEALLLSMPARLARRLLALADSHGKETAEGVRIELRLPQHQIGELIGAAREWVNKLMRPWAEEGLLSIDHQIVTLHDLDALRSIAQLESE